MKGREREILLDQLETESKKRPPQAKRRPRPLNEFSGRRISDEEVEATVAAATAAFRKVLETA
jgi:hypothetical protein